MKQVHDGLGGKNRHDRHGTKNLTEEQIRRYKMTERDIYEKYDNLSENELDKELTKEATSEMML